MTNSFLSSKLEDDNSDGSKDEDPSRVYQEIEADDNVKMHCLKQAHNAKVKQCLVHDVQKSAQDFQWLNDTVPGLLPEGWDTIHIQGCWECQNNFRGILHLNYYWSPTTNVVYVGEEARIACTHKIAGTIYRSHAYLKLYSWAPRGMPMNPRQLWLLMRLVLEGGPVIQM